MKTLRAKLFVSVGAILLIAGLLNTLSAELWIKKDLSKAGVHINERLEEVQGQIRKFVSFILTFRLVQEATELDRVIGLTGSGDFPSENISSLWGHAEEVLSYNPELSFVQIQNEHGKTVVIAPQDAHLSSFSWATDLTGTLWVKVEGEKQLFKAIPHANNDLLFAADPSEIPDSLSFAIASLPSDSYTPEDSAANLFESFLVKKELWLQKMQFIKALLPWQSNPQKTAPLGIIQRDLYKKTGACLLTKDLFHTAPLIEYTQQQEKDVVPSLVLRTAPQGKELDLVKSLSFSGVRLTLGISLTSLVQEISLILKKIVIATGKDFAVGSTPSGISFELQDNPLKVNESSFTFQNHSYFVSSIDLEILQIFLLTPEEEATSTSRFLDTLSETTTEKISLTLLGAALFSFLIALVLLNNISKKITDPIAVLSKAAETLGTGHYTDLVLPKIRHRQDEVATLAHSFEGMVSALKDRDKVHGLLNKVVSKEISQKILEQNIELAGEEKIVTLLFSDIRNFTHLAEGLPPRSLIEILNTYMTRMCRIIDETHGVVDKFIGDAIMTLYGAPLPLDLHAVHAIEAALAMKEDLSSWNLERQKANLTIFEIGIGIHTGLVYTGNMGAENRLNYTAIGSNVNQASRLCSVAKPMQILISEDTLNAPGVKERFEVQKLPPVLLRGIQNPVQVYEVTSRKG